MTAFTEALLVVSALLVAISIVWRITARLWPLPCPSWLGWLVEDAFVETVIGPVAGSAVDYLFEGESA